MKTKLHLLLVLIFFSFSSTSYSISQIGTYISYKHVSGNAYKVSLHIYRDCRGIGYNDSFLMKLEGSNNCFNSINFYVTRDTIINGTFECSTGHSCNAPNGPGTAGVEEQIFSATIDLDSATYKVVLDSNCCDLYFTYGDCCRNGAGTTGITGALFNYAYLNRCVAKDNNSTNYKNKIALNAYCNTTFEYNPFAIDSDGDSLVFSLDAPLSNSRTATIAYSNPLSPTIPITPVCVDLSVDCAPAFLSGFYTGFDFDSITNTMRLTPKNCSEVTTFVNKTDEYRKDTAGIWRLVGSTRRDQLIFISTLANNNIPTVDVDETYFSCIGDSINIALVSKDKAPSGGFNDSTFISWEHSAANVDISIDNVNVKNQTATIKWTPKASDISNRGEMVHLIVTESNCPRNTSTSKAIILYAVDSLRSNHQLIDRKNGTLYMNAMLSGGSLLLLNRVTWLVDTLRDFTTAHTRSRVVDSISRLIPGKYYVRLLIENGTSCAINLLDSIVIAPYFRFNFEGALTEVCKKNNLIIRPNLFTAKRPITYQWYVNGSSTQISSDSFLSVEINGDISYVLNAKDATNQTYFETISITSKALPDLSSVQSPSAKCFDEGKFDLFGNHPTGVGLSQNTKDSSSIWFNTVDSRRSAMVKQGIGAPYWYETGRFYDTSLHSGFVPSPNVDTLRLYARETYTGCIDSLDFWVRINANPIFELNELSICQATGVFRPNELLVKAPFNPEAGMHTWSIDSAPSGLSSFDLTQILIDEDPHPLITDYHFYPYIKGSDPSNPVNLARLGTYKLQFCFEDSATKCQSCASTYFTILPTPSVQFKPFPKLCYNDPVVQLDSFVNLKNGRWELKYFNGDSTGSNFNSAQARMIDSTQIDVNTSDNLGGNYYWRYVNESDVCISQDSLDMVVNKRPNLQLNINTDSLYLGETVLLNVTQGGGLNLKWENGNISPSRLIREFATPEGVNLFIMTGTNPTTSCAASDTAIITVFRTKRPTSIRRIKEIGLVVYPNPTQSSLNLSTQEPVQLISVIDPTGKEVFRKSFKKESILKVNKGGELDLSNLKPGVYILHISGKSGEVNTRIVLHQ